LIVSVGHQLAHSCIFYASNTQIFGCLVCGGE